MWQSLGNLIPQAIKKAGIGKQISDALICEEFNKIALHLLGQGAGRYQPVYLKDRCLWIAVLSSAVSNELKLYEADILKALADKFGEGRVVELRFMS